MTNEDPCDDWSKTPLPKPKEKDSDRDTKVTSTEVGNNPAQS